MDDGFADGVAKGETVGVGVGVGVLVDVAVQVGVCVAVGVGETVGFGTAVGVDAGVRVIVGDGVYVAVGTGVLVRVTVGAGVLVRVAVGTGVLLRVAVGAGVLLRVAVAEGELLRVAFGAVVLVLVAVAAGVLERVAMGLACVGRGALVAARVPVKVAAANSAGEDETFVAARVLDGEGVAVTALGAPSDPVASRCMPAMRVAAIPSCASRRDSREFILPLRISFKASSFRPAHLISVLEPGSRSQDLDAGYGSLCTHATGQRQDAHPVWCWASRRVA